jgi:hypothetical protein
MAEAIVLSRMWHKSTKGKRIYTEIEKDFIVNNYHRLSYRQMAEHLNTSKTNVCLFCAKLGLGKKTTVLSEEESPNSEVGFFDVYECKEKTWIV